MGHFQSIAQRGGASDLKFPWKLGSTLVVHDKNSAEFYVCFENAHCLQMPYHALLFHAKMAFS